jgi:hypothetical protein
MAFANLQLVNALRATANKLEQGNAYQWGHMGSCNCGNLAQTITHFTKEEIHRFAMERKGDWSEQVLEFCPSSGYPMDMIIQKMMEIGLTRNDLMHLEHLSDQTVLQKLPQEKRYLNKNSKEDAILYMRTMANILEAEVVEADDEVTAVDLTKLLSADAMRKQFERSKC